MGPNPPTPIPPGRKNQEIAPATELREVTVRYGPVLANDRLSLRVAAGTIHGVIGENGAGKSTAMKVLYGLCQPETGEVLIEGSKRILRSPADALRAGVGMVHQHFMLAGPYSALDNVLLGVEPVRWGLVRRTAAREHLQVLAARQGLAIPWDTPVESLPVGVQQRIEILKLLYRGARMLIFDEPTGVLTPAETAHLFDTLKRLRSEGKTILLVTHKLKEVMAVTDQVTVLRAGRVTGEVLTAKTNPQELADLMVGRKVRLQVEAPPTEIRRDGVPALEVRDLRLTDMARGRDRLAGLNLSVRSGEIVGIAGVEGNGQSDLVQALLRPSDPNRRTSGTIKLAGREITRCTTAQIRQMGLAVIPEDRVREGLISEFPVVDNWLLGFERERLFSRGCLLRRSFIRETARASLERYEVRPAELDLPGGALSGGNQQKLIVAREFQREPRLLIAAQPTRGVDVGAVEFIHQRLLQVRAQGGGVLLISSELDEILALADRILVMYEGRIVEEYARGEATEAELGLKMGGG